METLPKCRILKKLSGPTTFIYYPEINGKRLLLLGEKHSIIDICHKNNDETQEIHEWLYNLAFFSPTCLDLFVEDNIFSIKKSKIKPLNKYRAPLQAVRYTFNPCNKIQKNEKCNVDNLRYHLVDLRELDENYQNFSFTFMESSFDLSEEEIKKVSDILDKYFNNIIYFISGFSEDELGKKYYYKILKILSESDLNKYIENYEIYRIKYIKFIKKQIKKIENFDQNFFLECLINANKKNSEDNIYDLFIEISSLINMDVYFLLRYLHTYDHDKIERGPEKCRKKEFNTPKYSIVYGGTTHIEVYNYFFQEYYNIKPSIYIKKNKSCIKFSESFDFFE